MTKRWIDDVLLHTRRVCLEAFNYGVATISRLLKSLGLFRRIYSLLQGSFAKETCNYKEPTNRCHPIPESKTREIDVVMIFRGKTISLNFSLSQNILSFIGLFCKRDL